MATLADLTPLLVKSNSLTPDQADAAARALAQPDETDEVKKAFLTALFNKGETADEVATFAKVYRELARDPKLSEFASDAIDVCGTGGDKSGSFNISTTVGFLLAAMGTTVFKHGNRSITSSCGSADLQESVGVVLDADDDMLKKAVRQLNYTFFFAPSFHPAFRYIVPVRKALAAERQRTIFNILGPLINPGRPAYQLLGVFSADWVKPMADALNTLGLKRGLVVNATINEGGVMDELSCAGRCRVAGFGELGDIDGTWMPSAYDLDECSMADLKGGTVEENLQLLQQVQEGSAPKGLIDTICWNTGTALWIAGKADSVKDGIAQTREALSQGFLTQWLNKVGGVYSQ